MKGQKGARTTLYFSSLSLLGSLATTPRNLAGGLHFPLISIPYILLTIALARPATRADHKEYKSSGVDIVVAIDVSTSMTKINDFALDGKTIDRLTAAKITAKNFISKRKSDRIGVIGFAGRPYLVSPVTMAHKWLGPMIDEEVRPSHRIEGGTAVGKAIAFASQRLYNDAKESKSRVIVLITDGNSTINEPSPSQAADFAKDLDIKIYTLAIGTKSGRLANDNFNTPDQFDTSSLRYISEKTDGKFYRAYDTESIEQTFEEIDKLEKVEAVVDTFAEYKEYHPWFSSMALVSLTLVLLFFALHPKNTP